MSHAVHYSEAERVTVEDRGAGFGKIYVHRDDDTIEAIMVWTGRGVMTEGVIEPTREQKDRAIRALAETKSGAKALGVDQRPAKEPPAPTIKFKVEELSPSDLGVEFDGYNEPKAAGQWTEVDENRCAAGTACVGFGHKYPAAIGYHLRSHGDAERCEWITPWRLRVESLPTDLILCEDCVDMMSQVLTQLGFEEVKS
jgi:hypothetical protein